MNKARKRKTKPNNISFLLLCNFNFFTSYDK